jgi:hypothetical protein
MDFVKVLVFVARIVADTPHPVSFLKTRRERSSSEEPVRHPKENYSIRSKLIKMRLKNLLYPWK